MNETTNNTNASNIAADPASTGAQDSPATLVSTEETADYGVTNLWNQGDFISHTVVIMLVIMSILSWTKICVKGWRAMKRKKSAAALEDFWNRQTIDEAISKIDNTQGNEHFSNLAKQAINAAKHFDDHDNSIGASLERGEFITRAMRQSISKSTAKLESGLTMLASIGSVAPFVGLFGTVWGIYHALVAISIAGSATLNKVSGPVGEALIMTAAGLFVAIPAVLAYNAFVRLNRVELMELDGFAHDLLSYINTGARLNSVKTYTTTTTKNDRKKLQLVEVNSEKSVSKKGE